VGPAQTLAVKHLDYGVRAEHYTYVGNALLRTLKKGLGEDFTPEVRAAWIAAYQLLAGVMRAAAYGAQAPNQVLGAA
jgi:hemoglobin-like flavoprotein